MTLTVQIARPKPHLDQLIEQLQKLLSAFAAQPQPAADDSDDSTDEPDHLPPTSRLPGDPVDTSQHDPKRTPSATDGVRPASRENEGKPDQTDE